MVNILMVVGLGLLAFILLLAGSYFYIKMKSGKKFLFLLWNRTGTEATIINAKIKVDPENKANKMFFFDQLDSPLPIKPPSIKIGGVYYRQITFNELSEFNYLENKGLFKDKSQDYIDKFKEQSQNRTVKVPHYIEPGEIDDTYYKRMALTGEEKQVTLSRYKEYQKRYADPMNKYQAMSLVMLLLMTIIITASVIISTYQLVGNSKTMVEVNKESQKVANSIKASTDVLNEISLQNTAMISALTGDVNLTRRLT